MPPVPERFPGIRLEGFDPRGVLLWDGSCEFCRLWVQRFEKLARQRVRLTPVQNVMERLPEGLQEASKFEVLWIEPDGSVYGGSEAVARALTRAGLPVLGLLIGNPAVRPLTRAIYRWVACHRGHIGGSC